MASKLKINLAEGHLEVEGSETFVRDIYNDFRDRLVGANPAVLKEAPNTPKVQAPKGDVRVKSEATKNSKRGRKSSGKKKSSGKPDFTVLTDLNLRPSGKTSLIDWIGTFVVKSNPERILAITYYCKEVLGLEFVTANHIYTGFKELKAKIPPSLYQVIVNTKNRKTWIQYDNMLEDIQLTIQGSNHIEHDIQKVSD